MVYVKKSLALKRPAAAPAVEEDRKRQRKRRDDDVVDEFIKTNKKAPVDQINYKDLGAFDDLLTDCFIDKVGYFRRRLFFFFNTRCVY